MELKMYYFDPNNYDMEYFTIAVSKEEALENLKNYLKSKICTAEVHEPAYEHCYDDIYKIDYEIWENSTIDNLPKEYTITEYERGYVVETEIS